MAPSTPLSHSEAQVRRVCQLLRRGLEVSNRRKAGQRYIHRNVFIGGEAISFLTSRGITATRAEATIMGDQMIAMGLVQSIDGLTGLMDAYLFYRFTADKDRTIQVSLQPRQLSATSSTSSGPQKRWRFHPHTAHNSIVLDYALANEIEDAMSGQDESAKVCALLKLRERVRQIGKRNAPGWVLHHEIGGGSSGKPRIKTYKRPKPIGDFKTSKKVGFIKASPRDFMASFCDLDRRSKWEPFFSGGAVVESVHLMDCQRDYSFKTLFPSSPSSFQTPLPPERPPSLPPCLLDCRDTDSPFPLTGRLTGSHLWAPTPTTTDNSSPTSVGGSFSSGRCSSLSEGQGFSRRSHGSKTLSVDDEEENMSNKDKPSIERNERRREKEEEQQQHEEEDPAAAEMPVARFDDPGLQEVLKHLKEQRDCLEEAAVCCAICSAEKEEEDGGVYRMCSCCGILACSSCCAKEVYDLVKREAVSVCDHCYCVSSRITHPGPPKSASAFTLKHDGADYDEIGRDSQLTQEVAMSPENVDDEKNLVIQQQEEEQTTTKWANCLKCGEKVEREIDAIERHSTTCDGKQELRQSSRSKGRIKQKRRNEQLGAGDSATSSSSSSTTRIIYRTADSPSPTTLRPREACVFQDRFCDQDGIMYVYEISVSHVSVESLPEHEPVEILFLGYVARPVPGVSGVSLLSIISQVDARSSLPSWLASMVADGGRYGVVGRHPTEQPICFEDESGGRRGVEGGGISSSSNRGITAAGGANSPVLVSPIPTYASSSSVAAAANGSESRRSMSCPIERRPSSSSPYPIFERHGQSETATEISLRSFELLSVIGRGGFGKVYQVRHRTSRQQYAMKVLNKAELKRRNQIERTRTERQVMSKIRHPFIVRLVYAFHSPSKVYMVMTFCQGGDLFTLMRRQGRLTEDAARIYAAEIALALQHLHNHDIVYRDLKPENVLIAADGHIKLTDFGLCRYFEIQPPLHAVIMRQQQQQSMRPTSPSPAHVTHSFAGTEQYMCPEMLMNQGHGFPVDWWCLGLCIHEMLTRKHPFNGLSHLETLRNICAIEPMIASFLSGPAQSIITQLLHKNPDDRLGGLDALKEHSFFLGIDWEAVYEKRVPAAIVPKIRTPEDNSAFSSYYTDEMMRYSEIEGKEGNGGKKGGRRGGRKGGGGWSQGAANCLFLPFALATAGSQCKGKGDHGSRAVSVSGHTPIASPHQDQQQAAAAVNRRHVVLDLEDEDASFDDFNFWDDDKEDD